MAIPGLFITGTDTNVGKTHVAALIAVNLKQKGFRVGVYKPAASGCREQDAQLVSDDAMALWKAAGCIGDLEHVCPQRFAAPLAPHLAARREGLELNAELLRRGGDYWRERSDILLVEGVGGLMSPLGESEYVADLALFFGFPLISRSATSRRPRSCVPALLAIGHCDAAICGPAEPWRCTVLAPRLTWSSK